MSSARTGEKYAVVRDTLRRWLESGVLRADDVPALYVYEQSGPGVLQRGLIGDVGLAAPEERIILPHENVMPGPVADRLALMSTTQANLEPIFLLYTGTTPEPAASDEGLTRDSELTSATTFAAAGDAERLRPAADGRPSPEVAGASTSRAPRGRQGAASRLVDTVARERTPLVEAHTEDGLTHRLWAVTDLAEIATVNADLRHRQALIADGHHRYATYRELQRLEHARRAAQHVDATTSAPEHPSASLSDSPPNIGTATDQQPAHGDAPEGHRMPADLPENTPAQPHRALPAETPTTRLTAEHRLSASRAEATVEDTSSPAPGQQGHRAGAARGLAGADPVRAAGSRQAHHESGVQPAAVQNDQATETPVPSAAGPSNSHHAEPTGERDTASPTQPSEEPNVVPNSEPTVTPGTSGNAEPTFAQSTASNPKQAATPQNSEPPAQEAEQAAQNADSADTHGTAPHSGASDPTHLPPKSPTTTQGPNVNETPGAWSDRSLGPWDFGLALLVDSVAYPPDLKAIHRVIPELPLEEAAARAKGSWQVRDFAELDEGLAALDNAAEPAFLLAGANSCHLMTDPDPVQLAHAMPAERSARWNALNTSILAEFVLPKVWGMRDDEEHVRIVHHDAQAAADLAATTGGTAVILRSLDVQDVLAVAAEGERVPRKSTSFGPKPRTGLVLRTFAIE
ncbi:hypothetical protein GCM10009560_18610 [Nonomuraea longicatena]|uniref:DUF1015 family protein n=2 Tax=Nonomuraea longicatena TaxID=83682 RepID=A0ABN1P078_9ACTN